MSVVIDPSISAKGIEILREEFLKRFHQKSAHIQDLGAISGRRTLYRISGENASAIIAYNPDSKESATFYWTTEHFQSFNLPVPKIYSFLEKESLMLIEDLGDSTLLQYLNATWAERKEPVPPDIEELYRKAVVLLPRFQVEAGSSIDFSKCYPSTEFDRKDLEWDANYFIKEYVSRVDVDFDKEQFWLGINPLIDHLTRAERNSYLMRDYQARNLMVKNNEIFVLDYQSGRKGPLQYDLASLLRQSTAQLPVSFQLKMVDIYLDALSSYRKVDRAEFFSYYRGFELIRMLQSLATYGIRGLKEGKKQFKKSIPLGLKALASILDDFSLPINTGNLVLELRKVTEAPVITPS